MVTESALPPAADQRRICYVNFAEHLLNAFSPNMIYPGLPNRWRDADWFGFLDMIAAFGFTTFEFWLVPRLFSREGLQAPFGREFARQMNACIEHASSIGLQVELLAALTTVGTSWHTHCPRIKDEWEEVCALWDEWTRRLLGLQVVGIFPGDPGGCSRNGCTAETYIDGACQVAEIVRRNLPAAQIDLGTWGPPFFGWGLISAPPDWQGEFIPEIQHTAWRFDAARAESAMRYLLKRLPDFPADTAVSVNLGFNADSNPVGEQDARPWAQEIARTHPILTWDYSLTEGENAIYPHYRFDRLFLRRREERAAAPYSGGIAYTMTPLLNQLSLYESARSFADANADHASVAREFFSGVFGPAGAALAGFMPLFELVPDWGHYARLDLSRQQVHRQMNDCAGLLRALAGSVGAGRPFHPTPEEYRRELLFFAELFADLAAPAPDYAALGQAYWQRVYAIYDHLPQHVDPRPHAATERLIEFFRHLQ
jgi:hypothetical protein